MGLVSGLYNEIIIGKRGQTGPIETLIHSKIPLCQLGVHAETNLEGCALFSQQIWPGISCNAAETPENTEAFWDR